MTGREFLDRYAVPLIIVGVLALVVALLPGNAEKQTASEVAGPGSAIAAPTAGPSGPIVNGGGTGGNVAGPAAAAPTTTGQAAVAASDIKFGQGNCRGDGRQAGITTYMPPCLAWLGTNNGGNTARGVTKDKIKVVRYIGQLDPGTRAILTNAGLSDDESVRGADYEALRKYANQHYFTYGREVVFQIRNASGPSENDAAMKADAVKIANDDKAFAVMDGSPDAGIPKVLAQELAQRGVVCICTASLSSKFYKENPPYIYSSLPTSTEYGVNIGEYIGKRLKGKKAQWAGDEVAVGQTYRQQTRKFGLIYINGVRKVDPEGKRARDAVADGLKKYGVSFTREFAYIYEGGRNTQDVTNAIAQMKEGGVTTVLMLVDPLYPILFTKEASVQGYFPEWFITGFGLSDTTTAGRLYDQIQWRHAFGISPLWITWETVAKSGGFRARQHGTATSPDDVGVLINIYATYFGVFFNGVHMAGPILTADTFARGIQSYPPTGGKPGAPLVFWTRDFPTAAKDFTEVWYDWDRSGPDERGSRTTTGMMMKVDGGKRYKPGQWPTSNPKAFVQDGKELAVSDNPPGGGDPNHEQDGHTHTGACFSCAGFKTNK
jgi:ABC-type branched-subunit amino acid transport system substrate-binding protein